MAVNFGSTNAAVSALASDICNDALIELNVIAQGETGLPEDLAVALRKLQRIIDQWNASRELVFSISFQLFTTIANHAPHTIGPGGDFQLPLRPVDIRSASFILAGSSGNPVDQPILVRDKDWWAVNPVKSLVSSIITHLYYDPANPLGNLNFWPICQVANQVRLEIWNALTQAVSLNSTLGFAPGYWEAITLDLAVSCCSAFEKPVDPELKERWRRAQDIIAANNYTPPMIDTDSSGLPNSRRGGRPDFNFLTGLRE